MRKKVRVGGKRKLREYFLANIGKVLKSRDLQRVAGGAVEWARRIRELRDEEGFEILTHNDDSNLRPGEYILRDANPRVGFSRHISKELRAEVLARNGFTCQMCGIGAGEPHPDDADRKARLHIGHIVDKSMGGKDESSNLRALCSLCNEGVKNISPAPPSRRKLMAVLRKANRGDQIAALEWLQRKYNV